MDNNEIYKELGKMQANIENLQKDKDGIRIELKELKNDLKKEIEKLSDKLNQLIDNKKMIQGGWKAYAFLFTAIASASGAVKFILDFLNR